MVEKMRTKSWRLLLVEDDEEICEQVEERLQGQQIPGISGQLTLESSTSFEIGLQYIESHQYDVLILDLRRDGFQGEALDEQAGVRVFEEVQRRRFVPIIFYTALPHLVEPARPPTTWVVSKTDGISMLIHSLQEVFATGLPQLNRALQEHIEQIKRDYMWGFVAPHWQAFQEKSDHIEMANLLVRRLALSLEEARLDQLVNDLGGMMKEDDTSDKVHPIRYYIMPPVTIDPRAGDLYYTDTVGGKRYWILLTPSCDIAQDKADFVLIAPCELLIDQPEYKTWIAKGGKDKTIEPLLRNNRTKQPERYYFLPGLESFALPDLVVDFQQVRSVVCNELEPSENRYHRIASLDNPYAESLVARVSRYLGRLGTPDLDLRRVTSRLRSAGNIS